MKSKDKEPLGNDVGGASEELSEENTYAHHAEDGSEKQNEGSVGNGAAAAGDGGLNHGDAHAVGGNYAFSTIDGINQTYFI